MINLSRWQDDLTTIDRSDETRTHKKFFGLFLAQGRDPLHVGAARSWLSWRNLNWWRLDRFSRHSIPESNLPRASNRKYLFERWQDVSLWKFTALLFRNKSQFALLSSRNESYPIASLTISLKVLRLFLSIPGTEVLLYTGFETLYVLLLMSLFSSEESHIAHNVLCTPSLHLGTLACSLHMVHTFLALTLCSSFGMEVRLLSGFF
jgi:hypothetical protein